VTLAGLASVTVFETASCGALFDGDTYRIWKDFSLDSAVRDPQAPDGSPERRLHGHTFTLRLVLRAPLDAILGWTVDFGDVKTLFDPLFRRLDHQPLHELAGLEGRADTPALAAWIHAAARADLPALCATELYQTTDCGAIAGDVSAVPLLPPGT